MSSTSQKVVKNASALMGSQAVTWVLTLLLTVFLPRYLGASAVGQFHLGISIWAIMGVFITFGMDTFLVKEIARRPERTAALLSTTLILRGLLFTLSFGIVALYAHLAGYPAETVYVIYLVGVAQLLWQWSSACQAALQGLEIMEYIAISNIVGKAINTGLGIAVLLLGYGVYVVSFVGIFAALVNLLLQLVFLSRYHKLRLLWGIERAWEMLKGSLSYVFVGLALVFYMQVDIIIISLLVDEQTVGWYGAADQLFGTLLFIPSIFIVAIFPTLTRIYDNAPDTLSRVTRKSFDLMLLISVPTGLGILVIAGPLVTLLFGEEFVPSGAVLSVMGIVLIFTYLNILLGQFLVATDRQNAWTKVMVIATIATVPLDLVFIPWCRQMFANGAIGGALSYAITEIGMVIAGVLLLPQGALGRSNVWTAIRVITAGLIMAGATWWVRDMFIAIPIIAGVATYTALIAVMRVVPKEDITLLTSMVQHIRKRLGRGKTEPASVGGA